ncbi:MAG: hypothetical protein ABIJ56_04290 [Pseudomonadota bacterium]
MAVTATSGFFHNCYYFEGPELAENTPPVIDFSYVDPELYGFVDVDLSQYGDGELMRFKLDRIVDPDPEKKLWGRFGIDFDPYGSSSVYTGGEIAITSATETGSVWSGNFPIEAKNQFEAGKCHEVIAIITDREWVSGGSPFEVPETTTPAHVRWIIRAYNESEGKPLEGIVCTN